MGISMQWISLGRWLPGLALVAGLFLMAAATLGQGTAQPAPEGVPSVTASDRFESGPHRRDGRGGRHHFMVHFKKITPAQACKERFARGAGFLAYLGAKLDLNTQQQPLWDTYQRAMLDGARKQQQTCMENIMAPGSPLTALEHRDRIQKLLQARLDGLQTTRQPLEALYQSLSPDQRRLLDRPFMGWSKSRR
jgi:hypothetical protein